MRELKNCSMPFSEYLETSKEKFVMVITKSQYAILTGYLTHDDMSADLIKMTRPDIRTDSWGNAINREESYTNGNIIVCGYPGYIQVELPHKEMLSPEQFECLKEVFNDTKNYNQKIEEQGYGDKYELNVFGVGNIKIEWEDYKDKIDELNSKLSNYVKEPDFIPKEVIIGRKLNDTMNKSVSDTKDILETLRKANSEVEDVSNDITWDDMFIDWDNDFPIFGDNNEKSPKTNDVSEVLDFNGKDVELNKIEFDEENNKKLGYGSITLLVVMTVLSSIGLIVLSIIAFLL